MPFWLVWLPWRGCQVAATMVEVMKERYGLPDAGMDTVGAITMQILLLTLAGDEESRGPGATKIVMGAVKPLQRAITQYDASVDRKPVH